MEKKFALQQQHDQQMARIKQNAAEMESQTKIRQANIDGQIKSQQLAEQMKASTGLSFRREMNFS